MSADAVAATLVAQEADVRACGWVMLLDELGAFAPAAFAIPTPQCPTLTPTIRMNDRCR